MSIVPSIVIISTHQKIHVNCVQWCIWIFWHTWSFFFNGRLLLENDGWTNVSRRSFFISSSFWLTDYGWQGLVYVTHIGYARARYLVMPLVQFWFFPPPVSEIYQETKKTKQISFLIFKPKLLLVMFWKKKKELKKMTEDSSQKQEKPFIQTPLWLPASNEKKSFTFYFVNRFWAFNSLFSVLSFMLRFFFWVIFSK